MLAELRQQFLPQFIAETRTRLRSALALIPPAGPGGESAAQSIAEMMNTIAGEAMLIGSPELVLVARAAGGAARRYLETRNDAALVACARALRSLARAVEELSTAVLGAESGPIAIADKRGKEAIRVLVVDDSALNAALLSDALVRAGFEASGIGDDLELILARLQQMRPHILLVDLLMPRCDPRELIRRMRLIPALSAVRALLVTSRPEAEAMAQAREMGIAGAVSKEYGLSPIVQRVRALTAEVK